MREPAKKKPGRPELPPDERRDHTVRARVTAAEAAHTKDEAAYEAARSRLADRLTQQSETQAALSRSGDVSGALQVIAAAAPEIRR